MDVSDSTAILCNLPAIRLALERSINEEIPEERRQNGIRLERYVLLVVADKGA